MLFLTPDHELLHIAAGFVSSADLVKELDFVDGLWAMVKRAQTPSAKKHLVTNAHKNALRDAEKRTFTGPLASWEKRRVLSDHAFARDNPLLPASRYRSENHVGKSTSWFGSSSGRMPKDSIGTPRGGIGDSAKLLDDAIESADLPEDVKKAIRKKLGKQDDEDGTTTNK